MGLALGPQLPGSQGPTSAGMLIHSILTAKAKACQYIISHWLRTAGPF